MGDLWVFILIYMTGLWSSGWEWEIHHWGCGSTDQSGIPECSPQYQDSDDADGSGGKQVYQKGFILRGGESKGDG